MSFAQFSRHLPRVRHQLGVPLRLGGRSYHVRGYHANRQAVTLAHEAHLMAPLRRALAARSGAFVDVGVNTGQTLLKVLAIDPDRAYLGFEPQIGCCFCVQRFLADNGLNQARVVPVALSDRDGMVTLSASNMFDEMASLAPGRGTVESVVSARIGDDVLGELGCREPGIVKIDVEGAELEVLRGLPRTLAAARPDVFLEVLPNFTGEDRVPLPPDIARTRTGRADAIRDLLGDAGYRIHQIDREGATHPIDAFDLDDRTGYVGADYVATAH